MSNDVRPIDANALKERLMKDHTIQCAGLEELIARSIDGEPTLDDRAKETAATPDGAKAGNNMTGYISRDAALDRLRRRKKVFHGYASIAAMEDAILIVENEPAADIAEAARKEIKN